MTPDQLRQLQDEFEKILIAWHIPKHKAAMLSGELLEAAALTARTYGDQRAAEERELCVWIASWHTSTVLSAEHNNCARAIAAAIRASAPAERTRGDIFEYSPDKE